RLARMDDLSVLDETFTRPEGFQTIRRDLTPEETIVVRVLLDHEVARWAREDPSFFRVAEEETAEGLLISLHVRDEQEVVQWLLGWGSHLRVLEPESLRQRIAAEAGAMLRRHQSR